MLARSTRLHVVFCGARILDAIEQKEILLGAVAGNGKHIAHSGVGDSHSSRLLRGEIDNSRIQGHQFVIAPAIQWKALDLLFCYDAGHLFGGRAHRRRSLGHRDFLLYFANFQSEIHGGFLADGQVDSGAHGPLKTCPLHAEFVFTNGKLSETIMSPRIGGSGTLRLRF